MPIPRSSVPKVSQKTTTEKPAGDQKTPKTLILRDLNWSRWSGLNRRPTVYETVALPLSYTGLTCLFPVVWKRTLASAMNSRHPCFRPIHRLAMKENEPDSHGIPRRWILGWLEASTATKATQLTTRWSNGVASSFGGHSRPGLQPRLGHSSVDWAGPLRRAGRGMETEPDRGKSDNASKPCQFAGARVLGIQPQVADTHCIENQGTHRIVVGTGSRQFCAYSAMVGVIGGSSGSSMTARQKNSPSGTHSSSLPKSTSFAA